MAGKRERSGIFGQIPQNLKSRRIRMELGVSVLSAVAFPVGPTIIGTLNAYNAIKEVKDTNKKRVGSSYVRAGLYGVASLFEYGLQYAGLRLSQVESEFLYSHVPFLPQIPHVAFGLASSAIIGLATGTVTNTAFWEAGRKR